MEDSLEDYLKISKNKIDEPPIPNKDIHIISLKKKECDQRALKIVEFSIEGKLRPEVFTKCLPYITPSHYQDIVEERAVTKLCGYSVCGKRIPEMPKKQYFISTKSNKVYDITDRKNYCSNFCYKASLHLKSQLDDSPLWLRKFDNLSDYHLLAPGDGGLPGELVDQGIVKPVAESTFTPVNAFAEVSLQDMVDNEKGDFKSKTRGKNKRMKSHKVTMQTISENSEQIQDEEEEEEAKNPPATVKKDVRETVNFLPVIEENEENIDTNESLEKKENCAHSNQNTRKAKRKHPKNQKSEMETLLKRLLKEWLTIESYVFLFGEKRVKEILDEKKLSDYFDQLNVAELQQNQQAKYLEICKRLRLQQIADEKFDDAVLGKNMSPVPDYQKLKKETKDLNIKVKSFLGGAMYEKEDTNFPIKESSSSGSGEPSLVIPLVDVNSQNALRRKIFLQSITKLMQQLLQTLQLDYFNTLSDLQSLIKTFRLTAQTIVFKPFVWKFIAVALLHMLSLRDEKIGSTLNENGTKDKLEFFLSVPYVDKLIDGIMCEICDIDRFIQEYICSS